MKAIIVSPYAMPEAGANTFRVNSLAEFLKSKSVDVEVFAPERGVPAAEGVKRYKSAFELMEWILKSDSDFVIFTSPPITHGFFSGIAAIFNGKKFFLDLRDPWPNEESKFFSKRVFKLLFFKIIEVLTYAMAARITVVTDGIKSSVCKKGFCGKVVLAPNGTTKGFLFNKKMREKIRKKLGFSTERIVFVYSGSFIGWDVEDFIKAFREMQADYNLLLLIPNRAECGNEFYKLKDFAEKELGKKVKVIDINGLPIQDIAAYFSACDVGVSTVPERLGYCIKAKAYDYCAAGLFGLAKGPKVGSLKSLFSSHNIGDYFDNWADFKKFSVNRKMVSLEAREKRAAIARKNFNRDISNKIIFGELIKEYGRK